jgi:hypothetical protein
MEDKGGVSMEHLAYCDSKAKELERLLKGEKSMLIRGAAGRKLPHGKVSAGEKVYLIENDGSGRIKARGIVKGAFHSGKLTSEESEHLINENADKLRLTPAQLKRWMGKRYLCFIELENIEEVEPFSYERASNMDDWVVVESMDQIRV